VETVCIGGSLVACVALRLGGEAVGVMALVRAVPAGTAAAGEPRREIEMIASWLRGSVEAHLAVPPPPISAEAQRVGALRRALLDARSEPELEVVRMFGEAIAIWEDVEVRGYVEGLDGEYLLQSAPAGAATNGMPVVLPPALAAQPRELSRLTAQSLDHLGIMSSGNLLAARIDTPHGSRWLLIFSGPIDGGAMSRLSLYVDVLEHVLNEMASTARLQLHRAISRHLLAVEDEVAGRAERALDEIRQAVDADAGALTVTLPYSGHALAVGNLAFFTHVHGAADPRHVTVTRALAGGGTLALAVGRSENATSFGRRERDILDAVAEMLEPWAAAAAGRPAMAAERRASPRPFEQTVERAAAHAVEQGDSVSVVVIRLAEAMFRPGLTQRLAAQIRTHLRAAEPAGALTEGEIAALLFDTGPDQARAVVARLRRIAHTLDEGDTLASATMGVAWRAGGTAYDTPLVAAARKNALERAAGSAESVRIQ